MPSRKSTYPHLLQLLSQGLYTAPDAPTTLGATLGADEWRLIMEEAEKQTVSGIVFSAVSRLSEPEMPPVSVLAQWLARVHQITKAYFSMSDVLAGQFAIFEQHGLEPVLQKGHAAARFYPVPELRACGDIDLCFPANDRSRADALMTERGYSVASTPDRGSCYMIGATEAEHHSMLIEIHNPFHSRLIRDLTRVYSPQRVVISDRLTLRVPAPLVELLMINAHILKHCLGVGIGLRQFCDYSLAWRRLTAAKADGTPPAVDENEYFDLCRRLGILRWTRALHQFINCYLPAPGGNAVTPVSGRPEPNAVKRIFAMVSEGGNFGRYNPHRKQNSSRGLWQRKLSTMAAFFNNRSFVCRLVPSETFWTITRLFIGQIH